MYMGSGSGLLGKQLVLLTTELFLQSQEPKISKSHRLEPQLYCLLAIIVDSQLDHVNESQHPSLQNGA